MKYVKEILSIKSLEPKIALLIYKNKKETYIEQLIIENNEIIDTKGLSSKDIKKIGNICVGESKYNSFIKGELPAKVIYFNPQSEELVFYMPERKGVYKHLDKNFNCVYPNLIFHIENGDLLLYVAKKLKGKIEVVPVEMSNVTNGKMCFGSIKRTENFDSLNEMIDYYIASFYDSTFTHNISENFFNNNFNKFDYNTYFEWQKEKKKPLSRYITVLNTL